MTPEALARAIEQHVEQYGEQARWIIPPSGSVVVIDRKNRHAIRVLGLMPETSASTTYYGADRLGECGVAAVSRMPHKTTTKKDRQ
jgi:hypothetical protein